MTHFKSYIAATVFALGTTLMTAGTIETTAGPNPLSNEISHLIQKSDLIIEDDFKLKVLFRLDEEGRIQIHSVKSEDKEANEFLVKRLDNQKLHSKKWITGKLYELPIKVLGTR